MTTLYILDGVGNYVEARQHETYAPVPPLFTTVEPPPIESGFLVWTAYEWLVRDAPIPQPEPIVVPPPVPDSVSPLQIRRALRQIGLLDEVTAYVKASPVEVREAWEYAVQIVRQDPMIAGAAETMGMTSEEVDGLFRLAATL